jgi:spore maturation protein CgeB
MKLLILNADYAEFLGWFYTQHPGLESEPYEHQMRVRNESLFGIADFYTSNLRKLGYEVWNIHANNEFMQKAWANENGVRIDSSPRWEFRLRRGIVPWLSRTTTRQWVYEVMAAQIGHYKPDVLLNQAMDYISNNFLGEIKPSVKLLVGQQGGHPLPETRNWSVYDLVISSFPPTLDWFRLKGVPTQLSRLGFEPRVLSHLKDGERRIPVSFVGSLLPFHTRRFEWLEYLCGKLEVKVWSPHAIYLPGILDTYPIVWSYVGPAWGTEMYQVLRDSCLTLNHHGSVIGSYANNCRLFEATGVGTLLITDWKANLSEVFEPGKEVVCYRTPQECVEMVQYYLEHDREREAIARAGQQRTLRDHTYYQRTQEFAEIIQKYLNENKTTRLREISRRVLPPIAVDAGRWLLKCGTQASDTRVRFQYGQFFLECDPSHHLPTILANHPNFGRNLADVVVALEAQGPRVIDIGANIGDTAILLARFAPGAKVLCIEGDPRFIPYLKSNTAQINGVTIAEAILSDRSEQVRGEFVTKKGTAHVVIGEGGGWLQVRSLDDVLQAYPEFSCPDVIKIDTDGFETAILRGAKGVLGSARPVVFYEWHPGFYNMAGEDNVGHADLLMDLGYDGFMIFTNVGELLLRVRRPGHEVLESLAAFSRARRHIDDWHFDVAAFPAERMDVWERFGASTQTQVRGYAPLIDSLTLSLSASHRC